MKEPRENEGTQTCRSPDQIQGPAVLVLQLMRGGGRGAQTLLTDSELGCDEYRLVQERINEERAGRPGAPTDAGGRAALLHAPADTGGVRYCGGDRWKIAKPSRGPPRNIRGRAAVLHAPTNTAARGQSCTLQPIRRRAGSPDGSPILRRGRAGSPDGSPILRRGRAGNSLSPIQSGSVRRRRHRIRALRSGISCSVRRELRGVARDLFDRAA